MAKDQSQNIGSARAERDADSNLTRPLLHGVGLYAVLSDGSENGSDQREQAEQQGGVARILNLNGKQCLHGLNIRERPVRVDLGDRALRGTDQAFRVALRAEQEGQLEAVSPPGTDDLRRRLEVGDVEDWILMRLQRIVRNVVHNGDDFARLILRRKLQQNVLAYGIFVRPVATGHGFVDDGDPL